MLFEDGQRIVFIGDSITDCGRRDVNAPYGNGYMSLVRALVSARYPQVRLSWANYGVGGDTVRHLAERWDTDAIGARPDWLSVMIGINDVWRAFGDAPQDAVPIEEYEATLRTLLRQVVDATGCRLILADPYVIEPDSDEPQRATSDRYAAVMAALAVEFGAVHVASQAAFDAVLAVSKPDDWAADRIHPDLPGHAVLADAYLTAIGAR